MSALDEADRLVKSGPAHRQRIDVAGQARRVEGSMHATRHTALSGTVNAGVPLAVVSRVPGHESINTTIDVYGHVSEQSGRDAVDAAAGALGLGQRVLSASDDS